MIPKWKLNVHINACYFPGFHGTRAFYPVWVEQASTIPQKHHSLSCASFPVQTYLGNSCPAVPGNLAGIQAPLPCGPALPVFDGLKKEPQGTAVITRINPIQHRMPAVLSVMVHFQPGGWQKWALNGIARMQTANRQSRGSSVPHTVFLLFGTYNFWGGVHYHMGGLLFHCCLVPKMSQTLHPGQPWIGLGCLISSLGVDYNTSKIKV